MKRFLESILSLEITKFAIIVLLITVSAIIIWLLFRELKLWYWKTETIVRTLESIDNRLKKAEKRLKQINKEIYLINAGAMQAAKDAHDAESAPENMKKEETEQEIEKRIKE